MTQSAPRHKVPHGTLLQEIRNEEINVKPSLVLHPMCHTQAGARGHARKLRF